MGVGMGQPKHLATKTVELTLALRRSCRRVPIIASTAWCKKFYWTRVSTPQIRLCECSLEYSPRSATKWGLGTTPRASMTTKRHRQCVPAQLRPLQDPGPKQVRLLRPSIDAILVISCALSHFYSTAASEASGPSKRREYSNVSFESVEDAAVLGQSRAQSRSKLQSADSVRSAGSRKSKYSDDDFEIDDDDDDISLVAQPLPVPTPAPKLTTKSGLLASAGQSVVQAR